MDIRKIYEYALQREREGKRFFEENAERVSHAAASAFRRLAEEEQQHIEFIQGLLDVLRMAYLIERDFAEFYEMAASKAEGEAKQALQMLAEWERGHEALFKRLHDEAFEAYAQMPWGG